MSDLHILVGFAVSAKTGYGIEELKAALVAMVPAEPVIALYEKLLHELRSHCTSAKRSFIMAEDAKQIALSDKVRYPFNY